MSNQQIVERVLMYFADPGRRQDYFRLYSEDIVLHGYGDINPGLESVKQFYHAFWAVFPDAKVTVEEFIEQGDTLVVRYTITGTHQRVFMNVAATGKSIRLPGISILRFRNGQCFERWTCSDSLLLLSQIGGFPMSKVHPGNV